VMLSDPLERALVANVATPEELTVPLPSSVTPSRKFTLPNDDPVGVGLIVAVKVTDCPGFAGFEDDVSAVVVDARATPVPDRLITCVPALSTIVIEPFIGPGALGLKSTPNSQLSPGFRVAPGRHGGLKPSPAKSAVRVMEVSVSGAFPSLVTIRS